KRLLYGNESSNQPSRFINEINKEYLDMDASQLKIASRKIGTIDKNIDYNIGDNVIHNEFGSGIVVECDKMLMTVAFAYPFGVKKMIKGHSSIRKV
ncbi:MAG: hypothetical protein RR404_02575, partial [Bacilli bacterium]